MLKNRYLKNLDKFEAKKRAKLGDKAFLEKHIRSFSSSEKALKVLLPILLILNPITWILSTFVFIAEFFNGFYLFMMLCWFVITVFWIFNAIIHYKVRFKINRQKVEEWKIELNHINQAFLQPDSDLSI